MNSFWLYLGCFVVCLGGIYPAQAAERTGRNRIAVIVLVAMLLSSMAIVYKGLVMVNGWTDPFEGREAELAEATRGRRAGTAVRLLSVWPFFLIAIGAFMGFVSSTLLLRHHRARRS